MRLLPGLGWALAAFLLALGANALLPGIPALTLCVLLGVVYANAPVPQAWRDAAAPGLGVAAKRLLRLGIVLLGFSLSLTDIADLGWLTIALVAAVVLATFAITWALGRAFRLPGDQPVLLAAGFSICGASAIGAMSAARRSRQDDAATPVALVTLCGTLAIAVLPLLRGPLGLDAEAFGMWVGASVHDVGQVVATAQIAGPAALSVAVVVKLTRVAMLAPMVAVTSVVTRAGAAAGADAAARPPIVPLFLIGFLAAAAARTWLPLDAAFLDAAGQVQHALLGLALFGLGSGIRLRQFARTGARSVAVALLSWVAVAALAWGVVKIVG